MNKINTSLKHVQINKTNSLVVIIVSAAAFVVVMSGFAVNALLTQRSYQSRVTQQKEEAKEQLQANIDNADALRVAYQSFVSTQENAIGGASTGVGEQDGDNARLVLDSLPSRYDFPALVTSIEKILLEEDVMINSIAGSDEELSQSEIAGEDPIEIPFAVTVTGEYESIQNLVNAMERSIRPFHVNSFTLSGDDTNLRLEVQAKTYFQPEKTFEVRREIVR